MFGTELIDFITTNLMGDSFTDKDTEMYNLLISERPKIAKYNKLNEEDVYTDKVAQDIVKMKPKNAQALNKIYGFRKENMSLFGKYLIKKMSRFSKNAQ